MTTCKAMMVRISRSLDGDLDGAESAQLSAHLDKCPHCADIVRSLRAARSLLTAAKPAEDPRFGRIPYEVIDRPAAAPAPARANIVPFIIRRYAVAAAAIAVMSAAVPTAIRLLEIRAHLPQPRLSVMFSEETGSDGSIRNLPLGTLCYYELKKAASPIELPYRTFDGVPLASYLYDDEPATFAYDSPFFSDEGMPTTDSGKRTMQR
jgi:hypothetical protein